mmetsp:Transcript_37183/g.82715  ORF Transcript_37183/g.82715 Transcript_37183/m.82715 type:complete len:362 (-) Transcript_37183:1954-3039(-)|eukprot:CAMPEP_0202901078 /NCGR_PEP_ID=MMETSP1392-20130828/13129_1 /ASSEMBLY_ACC=CAM_ASM_000868 /TAXON_ID=225041 /ORGANISM="Chlamydomonas chlamydogama, Strain SAG 11-48b" /LENGTH=361 /DNA_ID=CAMNT_0049587573 /DNA_START=140 /DNA_END=1225 /DNA_ORIENTATION=+
MATEDEACMSKGSSLLGKRLRSTAGSVRPACEDFECAVCCDLLLDPVVAPCGHDMCSHCYQRWVSTSSTKVSAVCPLCRDPLPPALSVCLRLKKTIQFLYPDAIARRRIEVEQQLSELAEVERQHKNLVEEEATHNPSLVQVSDRPTYPQGPVSVGLAMQWAAAQVTTPSIGAAMAMAAASQLMTTMYAQSIMQQQQLAAQHDIAMGTPVLCQVMAGCLAPPDCQAQAPSSEQHAEEIDESDGRQLRQCHWQSTEDSELRLQCARAVIRLLRAHRLHLALGDRLPAAVRLLEVMLYRTAPSRAAYTDPATLETRLAAMVRRCNAFAALRQQEQADAGGASGEGEQEQRPQDARLQVGLAAN